MGSVVTDLPNDDAAARQSSPQNGLLLRADVHDLFDEYTVSVNPQVFTLLDPCLFINNVDPSPLARV